MQNLKNKKIIYYSHLFSGLETSIIKKKWSPTGAPTIYKILEKLDIEFDLTIILCLKNREEIYKNRKVNKLKVDKLNATIYLIPFFFRKKNILTKIISEIMQFIIFYKIYLKIKPKIIYLSNSNILQLPLISFFTRSKRILRIMGIYDNMKKLNDISFSIFKLKNIYLKFCYSIFNDHTIVTQDGSGSEIWVKNILKKKSSFSIMLNGITNNISMPSKKKVFDKYNIELLMKKKLILFVGRLEEKKGILEFTNSLNKLLKIRDDFSVIIIGSGVLEEKVLKFINKYPHLNIINIKKVPHNEINFFFNNAYIYVSLNKRGNLSNTNLEALNNNCAMIIPSSQKQKDIDIYTDIFLDNKTVIRIENDDIEYALTKKLEYILSNENKINEIKKNISDFVHPKLISWDNRIKDELKIINKIIDE